MTQEKTKVVYTLVDDIEMEVHMFSASVNDLAKDVIASFLSTTIIPKTFHNGMENEGAKDLLTGVSGSDSIDSLSDVLLNYSLRLAMLAV